MILDCFEAVKGSGPTSEVPQFNWGVARSLKYWAIHLRVLTGRTISR